MVLGKFALNIILTTFKVMRWPRGKIAKKNALSFSSPSSRSPVLFVHVKILEAEQRNHLSASEIIDHCLNTYFGVRNKDGKIRYLSRCCRYDTTTHGIAFRLATPPAVFFLFIFMFPYPPLLLPARPPSIFSRQYCRSPVPWRSCWRPLLTFRLHTLPPTGIDFVSFGLPRHHFSASLS